MKRISDLFVSENAKKKNNDDATTASVQSAEQSDTPTPSTSKTTPDNVSKNGNSNANDYNKAVAEWQLVKNRRAFQFHM